MTEIQIDTKTAEQYVSKVNAIEPKITSLTIKGQADLEYAAQLRAMLKTAESQVVTERKKITDPLQQAKNRVMDLFRPAEDKLKQFIDAVDGKIKAYKTELDRKAAEENRRLLAKAQAEEDKKRSALEKRAAKAEEAGKDEKAEQLRQEAASVFVVAPQVTPRMEKPEGLTFRDNWKAEVISLPDLIKAVASGQCSETFLEANTKTLNQQAKVTKDTLAVPGVRFYNDQIPVGRK